MRTTRLVCSLVCAAALTFSSVAPALAQGWAAAPPNAPAWATHATARVNSQNRVGAAEAAGPDAYENNDVRASATPLTLGLRSGVVNFYPNPGKTSDEDWFSFVAVAGHTYDISTRYEGDSIDTRDSIAMELDDTVGEPCAVTLYKDLWADDGFASRITWTAPTSGTYSVATWDWGGAFETDGHSVEYSLLATDLGVVTPGSVERIGGADRYEVAASLARNTAGTYAGVTHIVIASGLDKAMADALSASGLAGTVGGPVLLVRADRAYLPAPTKATIQACVTANPGATMEFHIVGGPASVPVGLEKQLRLAAAGRTVVIQRISGIDRYAVSANVAAHIRSHVGSGYNKIAFVVNGQNATYFSDALVASPVAAAMKSPILLIKSTVIPPATATALKSYPGRVLLGIPDKAIYESGFNALDASTPESGWLDWVFGFSREEIARHFAEYVESDATPTFHYVVANKLSDALTAGSAPSMGYDFVLYSDAATRDYGLLPVATDTFVQLRRASSPKISIVGGEASVGPDVAARLNALVGN